MILANLLLVTTGKGPDSFVSMDVMRLPLGILTGMGFIGAGAILHRENMILGVTTAATLWFTTLMGFCFGSGEVVLALSLLGLGVWVLWCLEWVEESWTQRREAVLTIKVSADGPSQEEIAHSLAIAGYKISSPGVKYTQEGRELRYEVHWRASSRDTATPTPIANSRRDQGLRNCTGTPLSKRIKY
jgi:putative Mg2+ transporter-C (MgtC) family protein